MTSVLNLTFSLLKQGNDPAQILIKLALRKALLGCHSVLDIGCGAAPTMRQLGVPRPCGLEGYRPSYEEAKRRGTQDEITFGDVRDVSRLFNRAQYDGCTALDLIEHLSKDDGMNLISDLERIATKRVVFFTPNGFLPQKHAKSDDLEEHLSGWEPDEMRKLGYEVIGLLGPKSMRGEYHGLKGRPKAFWAVASLLGHLIWTRSHPEKAAAILCVKSLDR